MQVQLERLDVQLKEALDGRAGAQESAELMRDRAERADAKLSELRTERRGAAAAAADEVCWLTTLCTALW